MDLFLKGEKNYSMKVKGHRQHQLWMPALKTQLRINQEPTGKTKHLVHKMPWNKISFHLIITSSFSIKILKDKKQEIKRILSYQMLLIDIL